MGRPTSASQFLKCVKDAGGSIGNGPLQRALRWDDRKYWDVHSELVDAGLIVKGRGYGGTVILVTPEEPEDLQVNHSATLKTPAVAEVMIESSLESSKAVETRELDLYDPALGQLRKHWLHRKQLLHCVCEKTALLGRRDTGGSWSRPDLVAVGLRKFEYIPGSVLEIYTFELKAEYDVSIKGVLEALSHREQATRSYVVYHTAGKPWDSFAEAQRIDQLAARHGVGVIVVSDIDDFGCWDERVTATRSSSDPESLDQFLKVTLTDESKSQIRKWF